MHKRIITPVIMLLFLPCLCYAGYKKLPLPQLSPQQCPTFQTSQNVTIGAVPFVGKKEIKRVFDTNELYKNGIVPILLVIENKNKFPIEMNLSGVELILPMGDSEEPVPWRNIVAAILRGKKIRVIGLPTPQLPEIVSGRGAQIINDFKEKSLEKLRIAPGEIAKKVVFFRVGKGPSWVKGSHLYITHIYNSVTSEELIYFEFDLKLLKRIEK